MTYCVGLKIDRGLVFMSDTRTNAGMDSISTFKKMHVWEEPGERVIVLMSAGNLATTQAVVSLLDERTKAVADRHATLLETPSMYQTVRLVGDTVKEVIASSSPAGEKADSYFNASFILGGQIKGSAPRLFMIYPEGNFIESTEDTPFFQIGETKYGKPIIIRAYEKAMSFAETVKLLLVSFELDAEIEPVGRSAARPAVLRKGRLQGQPEEADSPGRPILSDHLGRLVECIEGCFCEPA